MSHFYRKSSVKKAWMDNVVVVLLSGHIQTDDKLALRDITKQLNLENVVGDKVFGSFAEHLSFLLASLKTGDSGSKPIIFILDHFETFCSHKNQTLLYNLFDVAQSRAVPITVLGISSSIDVTELLEKRVKSRFSHRHLYLWPINDIDAYITNMEHVLTLSGAEFSNWNSSVKSFLGIKAVRKMIEQKVYAVDNSFRHLKLILLQTCATMALGGLTSLSLEHIEAAVDQTGSLEVNSLTDQLRDLSVTELCILIAIKHLEQIYDGEPFNFEMVYHEFVKFKRRKYSMLTDDRSVITKCWENLLALELVTPKGGAGRGGGVQEQYSLHVGGVPASILVQAVEKYSHCPTEVSQWLHSSHHAAGH